MLKRLVFNNFRNYPQVEFLPSPSISLISGDNGSGKSSLLEAIYTLSTGKSFRTTKLSRLVSDDAERCTLFAEVQQQQVLHRIGMSRIGSGADSLRIDGARPRGLSELARLLPVQVFHPDSVNLVYGEAATRRSFLDWGLFHVEQSFLSDWRRFRNILQQRNQLLKQRLQDRRLLAIWDQQLIEVSARIDQLRRAYIKHLELLLPAGLERVSHLPAIQLDYYPGWPHGKSLEEALARNFDKDLLRGFTSVGPQRADLRLKFDGQLAKDLLSRGECKILGYALLLSQLQVMQQASDRQCVLLVDDMVSELDAGHCEALIQELVGLGQQMIITAVDRRPLIGMLGDTAKDAAMFHVEHGGLSSI